MPSFVYEYPLPLQRGVFKKRLNRFSALVEVMGQEDLAHVPNSGRLSELLAPGRCIYLADKRRQGRKTSWDLVLSIYNDVTVCIDARMPNILFGEMVGEGAFLPFLQGYELAGKEPAYGSGRFDFILKNKQALYYLEVKSVTLVKSNKAYFPDAPTTRGARHLKELAQASGRGFKAGCMFIVQRGDADSFSPNDVTDKEFGDALREAAGTGVELFAVPIPPCLQYTDDKKTASCYFETLKPIPVKL